LQDIRELDGRGIPGGYVASEPFLTAARSHGDAIGFHADGVFVSHPIQDRTHKEVEELADKFFESIFELVCTKIG